MATSVQCGYALWQDGGTYNGLLGRTQHIAASFLNVSAGQVRGGVMPSGGGMVVTPGSGMSVNVSTGYALCEATAGSTSGGYLFGLMAAANLTLSASDPTNPRVDAVIAYVSDPGTSAGFAAVETLTGTPTSGANLTNLAGAPSAPSNGMVLAYVLVPAGSTSVTSGNILTDSQFTVAQGGILPATAGNAGQGYEGMYVHDPNTGRLLHNSPTGIEQPVLLPFVPQSASKTSNTTINQTSQVTLCSVTITTDGVTDIEITYKWPGLNNPTNSNSQFIAQVYIDSTQVDATYEGLDSGVSNTDKGGCVTYRTSAALGTTPSAGTHNITFKASNTSGGGSQIQVVGAAASPVTLYVKPICQ